MNPKTYIGFDNGVSGSVGIVSDIPANAVFFKIPTMREKDYQKVDGIKRKKEKYINRIDFFTLAHELKQHVPDLDNCFALIERPFTNPEKYYTSISAAMSLEAVRITLNLLGIKRDRYDFCDSKEWQKVLLPGTKGSESLKKWSKIIGEKLYPTLCFTGDADGLLIAHYAKLRRM